MKKIGIVLISLMMALPLFAQKKELQKGIIFEEGTLAQALAKAKNNKKGPKLVFVDCYTEWCGPCKAIAKDVFPLEHVGKFFNANFVNMKIDMEKGEGVEIGKKYGIRAYPTFLILDGDGNEINRVIGGGQADRFIERVKKAMDPSTNPDVLKERYLTTKSSPDAIAYLEALNSIYQEDKAISFLEEIFPTLNPRVKYSDKIWPYLSKAIGNPNSTLFTQLLEEKSIADNSLNKVIVDEAICSGIKNMIISYLAGRANNLDKSTLLKRVEYLNLLSSNDAAAPFLSQVAKLYSEGDIEAIGKMLNANNLMRLSEADRSLCERAVMSIKDFPKEKMIEYFNEKLKFFNYQTESITRNIKRLSE